MKPKEFKTIGKNIIKYTTYGKIKLAYEVSQNVTGIYKPITFIRTLIRKFPEMEIHIVPRGKDE